MQPFGDAFIVQTPHLNKMADRMYMQQQQREALQRQEAAMLDKQMQDEIGVIRNLDRDAYLEKYNAYKSLKKRLMFDPKLQRNPKEYNAVQMQAEKAFADAKMFAGESAEIKDLATGLTKSYMQNPLAFADDAGARIAQLSSVPLDRIRNSPFADLQTYMYQGPDANFLKLNQGIGGAPSATGFVARKQLPGGLQEEVTEYKFGATPEQRKGVLMNAFADPRQARMADRAWSQLDKTAVDDVVSAYENLKDEDWEQRTGKKDKRPLKITENMSNAEKYATFQAMRSFVEERPVTETKTIDNKNAIDERNFKQQKELIGLREQAQARLLAQRKAYKEAETEEEEVDIVEESLDDIFNEAAATKPWQMNYPNGKAVKMYSIQNRPDIAEMFEAEVPDPENEGEKMKAKPDLLTIGEDDKLRFTFYKRDDEGKIIKNSKGLPMVDNSISGEMSKRDFAGRYGKQFFGISESNKSLKKGKPKKKKTVDDYLKD